MKNYRILILIAFILVTVPAVAQNKARFSDIKPGMTDKIMEHQAIILANRRGTNFCWHEDYSKAKIISTKWQPDLDKNGFIRGRIIHIELYGQFLNGKCIMTDFTYKQKLLPDDTYSDMLYYDSAGDMVYAECE